MNLGSHDIFTPQDTPALRAQKLESTFDRVWRIFGELDKRVLTSQPAASGVNGHSSAMPDVGGTNPDHDKRYYTKAQLANYGRNDIAAGHRHYQLYDSDLATVALAADSGNNVSFTESAYFAANKKVVAGGSQDLPYGQVYFDSASSTFMIDMDNHWGQDGGLYRGELKLRTRISGDIILEAGCNPDPEGQAYNGAIYLRPGSGSSVNVVLLDGSFVSIQNLQNFGGSTYSQVYVSGDVDGVAHMGFRTKAELLSDIGASASAHRHYQLYDADLTDVALSADADGYLTAAGNTLKIGAGLYTQSFGPHDYRINAGCEFNIGGSWYARSTVANIMLSSSGGWIWYSNESLTPGNTFSPTEKMRLTPYGYLQLATATNAGTDTDKFLVFDGDNAIKIRTGSELLSDIGAVGGSGTAGRSARFTPDGTHVGDGALYDTGTAIGVGVSPSYPIHALAAGISITADNTTTNSYAGLTASYSANTKFAGMFQFGPDAAGTLFGVYKKDSAMLYSAGAARLAIGTYDNVPLYFGTNSAYAMAIATDQTIATAKSVTVGENLTVGTGLSSPAVILGGTGDNAGTIRPSADSKYWYFFSQTNGSGPYMAFVSAGYVGALTPGVHVMLSSAASKFIVYNGNADYPLFQVTAGGNVSIPVDSRKLLLGTGDDASITYDGTNMVINTRENGTGNLLITGGNVRVENWLGIGADPNLALYVNSVAGTGHIAINNGAAGGNQFVIGVATTADTTYGAAGSLFIRDGSLVRLEVTSGGAFGVKGAFGANGVTPSAKRTHVADPSGGSTVDAESRTAINAILASLEAFGLHATA